MAADRRCVSRLAVRPPGAEDCRNSRLWQSWFPGRRSRPILPKRARSAMPTFPLPFVPRLDWSGPAAGKRYFGAPRPKGRQHAGCDLIARAGTEVFAVNDGVVLFVRPFDIPYLPGVHVKQIAIDHTFFVARYCELRGAVDGLARGTHVLQGDLIGYVGQLTNSAMLHFEMYAGDGSGEFTDRGNRAYKHVPAGTYQRRSDLLDPTEALNQWRTTRSVRQGGE